MIKDSDVINDKALIISTESLQDLHKLYPYDMIQLELSKKKLTKKEFNSFIDKYWKDIKDKYNIVIVIGSELFKFFTKVKKAGNYQTEIYSYDNVYIIQGIKYQNSWLKKNKYLYYISMRTINKALDGIYEPVRIWDYIDKSKVIYSDNLSSLYRADKLVVDLETIGVRAENAKIFSISITDESNFNTRVFKYEPERHRDMLLSLFKSKTLIFHNALFDVKILITNLFMSDINDLYGMREGILWFKENVKIEDTMLLVYHLNNNTQGNELSLKFNTLKYTGVYALDVSDIEKLVKDVGINKVLEYNAIDTLATAILYKNKMVDVYSKKLYDVYAKSIESLYYLIEMMIVGLPMNQVRLREVKNILSKELEVTMNKIIDFTSEDFNPGSSQQVSKVLYQDNKLPIIEYTQSKQPSVSGDTLKDLKNHTKDTKLLEFLDALKDFKDINKILTGFIEPFYKYIFSRDKTEWITGNQKLGGTISGRLSSNAPNLANLPSNSKYGKLIKSIFQAPKGWLFCGSDFSALEDSIIANLSRDPMKVKVFTEGYDGHCINTAGYFKEELEARDIYIDMDSVESVNSIKTLAKDLRQESKAYTFGMSYGQLAPGMAKKQGINIDKAQKIVDGYQNTYSHLIEWNESNKIDMQEKGYVKGCWGHRVKTPLIKISIINSAMTPSLVKAEFRSANNAITQSYGMLTTIAGSRFQELVERSPYKYKIFISNQIHDAIYLVVKNEPDVIKWVNDNLIKTMCIMDEPRLLGAPVKLKSELDIGKSWDKQTTIENNISKKEVINILKDI